MHVKPEKTPQPEQSWGEKKQACRYCAPWLLTILQSHSNKTAWDWQKNGDLDRKNRTESPEIKPHVYVQLTCDKGVKSMQGRKDSLFNEWRWESWTATHERMKLDLCLTLRTETSSEWIRDLNARPETMKLPEENTGGILFGISLSNRYLDPSPQEGKQNQNTQMGLHQT